jgi:hypothetical protein
MGGLLLALFLGRAPLLRGLAGLLVAEDPDADANWLLLNSGDGAHDVAANRFRDGGRVRVLLIESVPGPLEVLGVLPQSSEIARRALEARGVPGSAIRVLPGEARDDWGRARVLRGWLRDHPGAHVSVLCRQFGTRRLRVILDRALGPDGARAHLEALPDRRYDETNWWASADGRAAWLNQSVKLAYVWVAGEGDNPEPAWGPDACERALP